MKTISHNGNEFTIEKFCEYLWLVMKNDKLLQGDFSSEESARRWLEHQIENKTRFVS